MSGVLFASVAAVTLRYKTRRKKKKKPGGKFGTKAARMRPLVDVRDPTPACTWRLALAGRSDHPRAGVGLIFKGGGLVCIDMS